MNSEKRLPAMFLRPLARWMTRKRQHAWMAIGVWLGMAWFVLPWTAHAETVRVAVASNFAQPARILAKAFETQTGHTAEIALGATGQLFAQIQHGAPFDVLLSADQQRPSQLAAMAVAVASSQFTYATGQLALWSASPQGVDSKGAILLQAPPANTRMALANPKLAPYGAAALEVLDAMQVTALWQRHWVTGENIAQTHQFVASGNASLGFVALSQVMKDGQFSSGSGWIVPNALHAPIAQDAVLLQRAASKPAALAWMAFLKSDTAAQIIQAAGYLR